MKKYLLILSLCLSLLLGACSGLAPITSVPVISAPNQGQEASVSQPPVVDQVAATGSNQPPAQQTVPTNPTQRSISVNGTGEVTLAPEMANIYVGIHSQSDNVANALKDNNDKAQAVSKALKDLGIDEKDIQTSSFNITPQQQFNPQGESTGQTIYSVDNTVYITVRKLDILGQLLDVAVRSGANSINGISFDVTDATKQKAVADARKLAVDSALSQAQALASDAGVQVDQLLTLTANTTGNPVPLADAKNSFAAGASQVPISAGQIVIHVDVSATYSIK